MKNEPGVKESEYKNSLYGWDDGKVYLELDDLGEVCISEEPDLMEGFVALCKEYYHNHSHPNNEYGAQLSEDLILVEPTAQSSAGLSRLIGMGKGGFATSEDADQFVRDERDSWSL